MLYSYIQRFFNFRKYLNLCLEKHDKTIYIFTRSQNGTQLQRMTLLCIFKATKMFFWRQAHTQSTLLVGLLSLLLSLLSNVVVGQMSRALSVMIWWLQYKKAAWLLTLVTRRVLAVPYAMLHLNKISTKACWRWLPSPSPPPLPLGPLDFPLPLFSDRRKDSAANARSDFSNCALLASFGFRVPDIEIRIKTPQHQSLQAIMCDHVSSLLPGCPWHLHCLYAVPLPVIFLWAARLRAFLQGV